MDWTKEIMSIIPPLTFDCHKGQAGRIGIVGGSKDFTGAPYFAGISALKIGCDISHVFCTPDASQAIKSYNPELIVHPTLGSPNIYEEMQTQLPFLHSLVIGPGLGREKNTFQSISVVVELAVKQGLPLVFDADALYYLFENQQIAGYNKAILTPNKVEFAKLYKSVTGSEMKGDASENNVKNLAEKLGHVTIIAKGRKDIISDGNTVIVCDVPGSPRRCGGQGDILSGAVGVFNYWAHKAKLDDVSYQPTILAAMAACMLTRRCNYLAFQKCKRSTLTTDMIGEINEAFSSLFS